MELKCKKCKKIPRIINNILYCGCGIIKGISTK